MQCCVWESPMLGCTAETDDMQHLFQLESQMYLEMCFRFLLSNCKTENDLCLVCLDGPINTELFSHSSESHVHVHFRACIVLGIMLTSFLSQCPVWYNSGEVLTGNWWDGNHGLWLAFPKWDRKQSKQASPGLHEQCGLKSNTFLATTVLWHLI